MIFLVVQITAKEFKSSSLEFSNRMSSIGISWSVEIKATETMLTLEIPQDKRFAITVGNADVDKALYPHGLSFNEFGVPAGQHREYKRGTNYFADQKWEVGKWEQGSKDGFDTYIMKRPNALTTVSSFNSSDAELYVDAQLWFDSKEDSRSLQAMLSGSMTATATIPVIPRGVTILRDLFDEAKSLSSLTDEENERVVEQLFPVDFYSKFTMTEFNVTPSKTDADFNLYQMEFYFCQVSAANQAIAMEKMKVKFVKLFSDVKKDDIHIVFDHSKNPCRRRRSLLAGDGKVSGTVTITVTKKKKEKAEKKKDDADDSDAIITAVIVLCVVVGLCCIGIIGMVIYSQSHKRSNRRHRRIPDYDDDEDEDVDAWFNEQFGDQRGSQIWQSLNRNEVIPLIETMKISKDADVKAKMSKIIEMENGYNKKFHGGDKN